ncbi:MAG: hypothetical protein KDA91_11210, partial [Planctomycetaceae bacterium]|nr:hypothetical protein [Planctomycetaceae bacterium]
MSDKHYVHQPEETELAKVLRESRSWFDTYGTTLIYGLSAILAVVALVVYIQRRPAPTAPASMELLQASTVEQFRDIADKFSSSEIGIRARLRQAELQMNSAVNKMFSDRATANEELEAAQKAYDQLIDRSDIPSDVRESVLAGVARLIECRNDGSETAISNATKAWQKLIEEFPDSEVYKEYAESRIESLKSPDAKTFYAWFHAQDPKPGDDLLLPQDKPAVPNVPNAFELPELDLSGGLMPATSTPAEPASDTPKPDA